MSVDMSKQIHSEVGAITAGTFDHATNVVAAQIGETAQSKGFREEWELADRLEEWADHAQSELRQGGMPDDLRAAARALRRSFVGMKLMLMVSEISEALEVVRDQDVDGIQDGAGNFGEELADTVIRVYETCHLLGIDIGEEIVEKILKNQERPYKHGRTV